MAPALPDTRMRAPRGYSSRKSRKEWRSLPGFGFAWGNDN